MAEGAEQRWRVTVGNKSGTLSHTKTFTGTKEQAIKQAVTRFATSKNPVVTAELVKQDVAEGRTTYGPVTDAHKASSNKVFAAGVRDGKAGAEKNKQHMASALMKTTYLNGYKQGEKSVAEGSKEKTPGIALSKAYKKDFDDKKPGHTKPDTALTGAYSKTGKPGGPLVKNEGAKVDRMVKHIEKSEKNLGKSKDEAENIAWATANKRGMLDNKNKKAK
jgi:hypothetical protein